MTERIVSDHGYRALRELALDRPDLFLEPNSKRLAQAMAQGAGSEDPWSSEPVWWSSERLSTIEPPTKSGPGDDATHARQLAGALRSFSPHRTADHRLWATLTCFHLAHYVPGRWAHALKKNTKPSDHVTDHWLFSERGTRTKEANSRRANAARRLWCLWTLSRAAAAESSILDAGELLDAMAGNVGLYHQVLSRSYLAASPRLLAAVYEVAMEPGNEHLFRKHYANQLLMSLQVRASAVALELMSADERRTAVREVVPVPRTKKKR